jgi:hypothetical protein
MHVASQILAAVEARLASIADVYLVPLHAVPDASLPAILIQNIEDDAESIGSAPMKEKHRLSFEVWPVVSSSPAGFSEAAGELRSDVEKALLATKADAQLDGLCRPGLVRTSASFETDADSLSKPVGGWNLKFNCVYQLSTDAPDTPI